MYDIFISSLYKTLDNTFIGTVLAGLVISLIGLQFYRTQKRLDLEFEDIKKTKDAAAILYGDLDVSRKKYEGAVNAYSGNPTIKDFFDQLQKLNPGMYEERLDKNLMRISEDLQKDLDHLVGRLKIKNSNNIDIKKLSDDTAIISVYLTMGSSALKHSSKTQVEELRINFTKVADQIETQLRQVLK